MKQISLLMMVMGIGLWMSSCGGNIANDEKQVVEQVADESAVETKSTSRKDFKLKDGLLFERPTPEALKEENPYNVDNEIFTEGRQFIYAYTHYRPKGAAMYNRPVDGTKDRIPLNKAWIYQPINDVTLETIVKLRISVADGYGRMGRFLTKKNYTFLKYEQLTYAGDAVNVTQLGMVENERNIWMPPPRRQMLNIMQSCPFPFIKAPFEVGNTWEWTNEVSKRFSDPRWGDWQSDEEMKYTYKISDKKQFDTKFGLLECLEVKASGGGLIGQSSLVALFHPDYGFVRLTFKHIDKSTTVMELDEIIDPQQEEPETAPVQ